MRTITGTYSTQLILPVTVHYSAVPASRGATDGRNGPKISPDEPARIEIESVEWDGKQIELTSEQEAELREEIGESLE